MKRFTIIGFYILIMMISFAGKSQTSKLILYDSVEDRSELRIGTRYSSDYIYMGRSDSAKAPYLTPSIGYYHKSGFFVNTSLSYLTAESEGRVDLYTASGGYDYYGKCTNFGISVSEYFFNTSSYAVQSEMTTYINAYAGYDFKAFMLYTDMSVGLSSSTDYFLGVELNRTFFLLKNKLRIIPSFTMNTGTQHFYESYYTYRSTQTGAWKGKGKGGMNNTNPTSTTTSTLKVTESTQYNILDYEPSLQVVYKMNNIRFYMSGTWTYPVNPAKITTDQGTYTETLNHGFFWVTGIRYIIK